MTSSAMEMRSPVLTSMSYSRGGWVALTELARWMRSSVVLPMALTTATTSEPWRRVRAMWSATARIRSASPTEVPPNFWTTSGIRTRLQTAHRPAGAPAARRRASGSPVPPSRVGDPSRPPGLGRVSGRAQRQESPSARGQGGASGRRGPEPEAPQADPQHHHRRGDRRGHRRHRLPGLRRATTTRGLQVERDHHDHDGRRGKSTDAKLQAQANEVAVKAGCPASPKTPTAAASQKYTAAPPMTIDTTKQYTATIKTTTGTFDHALDAKAAPKTVNNFVFLANKGYYHCGASSGSSPASWSRPATRRRRTPAADRATPSPTSYPPKAANAAQQYPLGSVAMANTGQPNTGGSQFFIVAGPAGRVPAQHLLAVRIRSPRA